MTKDKRKKRISSKRSRICQRNNDPQYVVIGMPIPVDCKVDIYTALFCGRFSLNSNVKFSGKVSHEAAYAKNLIVQEALTDPKVTHIFFLDADTRPPDDALYKLLVHDKDIVAGVTPMFFDGRKVWSASTCADLESDKYIWLDIDRLPGGLFKASGLGGTTILIKRRVFEAMDWPYFYNKYSPDGSRTGEDVNFTKKAQQLGFELFCDPNIRCGHQQTRDLMELFS